MVEAVIVVSLFAALLIAGGRRTQPELSFPTPAPVELGDGDLPCPWCLAPTREDDPVCPSCGQRFG